jgi:hypothetical protein
MEFQVETPPDPFDEWRAVAQPELLTESSGKWFRSAQVCVHFHFAL